MLISNLCYLNPQLSKRFCLSQLVQIITVALCKQGHSRKILELNNEEYTHINPAVNKNISVLHTLKYMQLFCNSKNALSSPELLRRCIHMLGPHLCNFAIHVYICTFQWCITYVLDMQNFFLLARIKCCSVLLLFFVGSVLLSEAASKTLIAPSTPVIVCDGAKLHFMQVCLHEVKINPMYMCTSNTQINL